MPEDSEPTNAKIRIEGDPEIIKKIITALKEVYDPEIPVNVYDLGLIYEIKASRKPDGKVSVHIVMTMTAIGCPVSGMIAYFVEEAIREAVPEADDVNVDIVFDPPWNPERVTKEGRELLKTIYGYDVVEEWKKRTRGVMPGSSVV
ncbi:MAG: metal-sulfur cluster assembly factor [Desulfurococcales archaeon]|nr:metal-sulfur cluster assembly factor [Desulfurococcales archaeon]